MGRNNIVGAWGEALAADFLKKNGCKLVASGYRCKFGEIDLIMKNRKYLLFVEVKLRKSSAFADAREFVDFHKQNRIRTTAEMYLAENPTNLQPRFDVVWVTVDNHKVVGFNYVENAFDASK